MSGTLAVEESGLAAMLLTSGAAGFLKLGPTAQAASITVIETATAGATRELHGSLVRNADLDN
ncbi:MAG TPA: hypothetical protein VHW95_18090 [Steroidobacteraceae bacterium]|nr:hypothetical protein [Steroidobacteraceae bacterium]